MMHSYWLSAKYGMLLSKLPPRRCEAACERPTRSGAPRASVSRDDACVSASDDHPWCELCALRHSRLRADMMLDGV
jgi:hypothetical protein